jgi:hypothetical protein
MSSIIADLVTSQLDGPTIQVLVILAILFAIVLGYRQFSLKYEEYNARATDMETAIKELKDKKAQILTEQDVEMRCQAHTVSLLKRLQSVFDITASQCKGRHDDMAAAFQAAAYNIEQDLRTFNKSFDPFDDMKKPGGGK